jgi:E3 ubiquitin-protein ligase RNF115/126
MIINLLGSHEESNLENIINHIMMNDTNRYGNPPASKKVLETLEKIVVTEDNLKCLAKDVNVDDDHMCSICKDAFEVNQKAIYLTCKHLYHEECILPWLKERNSCPTCRFELPTDDPDYENKKNA